MEHEAYLPRLPECLFTPFVNVTDRHIYVNYINSDKKFVSFLTIKPNQRALIAAVNPYPWVFTDKYTGERMHVENSPVYYPVKQPINTDSERRKRLRIENDIIKRPFARRSEQVTIHYPMRSLRQNALWAVVKQIKKFEDIQLLDITSTLKTDLELLYTIYDKHQNPKKESST